jgi:hypothetical protein
MSWLSACLVTIGLVPCKMHEGVENDAIAEMFASQADFNRQAFT